MEIISFGEGEKVRAGEVSGLSGGGLPRNCVFEEKRISWSSSKELV